LEEGNFEREHNLLRNIVIKKEFYSKGQLHLTEALRFWLELLGVSGADPFSAALTTAAPNSLVATRYELVKEKKTKKKVELPDLIDDRIPLFVFHETAGDKCKQWRADHWCKLFSLLAREKVTKNVVIILSKYKDSKDYQKIKCAARQSGICTGEVASGCLAELTRLLRYPTKKYRDVITVGLDSMGAGHLGPTLGTHSVVISHRNSVYGGDPVFSAPLSHDGKICLLVLPRSEKTDASDVEPEDAAAALDFIFRSIAT